MITMQTDEKTKLVSRQYWLAKLASARHQAFLKQSTEPAAAEPAPKEVWMDAYNRQRLATLRQDVAGRIRRAIREIAEGLVTGIARGDGRGFTWHTEWGDRIFFDRRSKEIFIDGFIPAC